MELINGFLNHKKSSRVLVVTLSLMQYPSAAPKNRALVVLGAQWGDEGKVI